MNVDLEGAAINLSLKFPPPLSSQNGFEYDIVYEAHRDSSPLDVGQNRTDIYAQHCYDATWTLAFALNKTITGTIIQLSVYLLVCVFAPLSLRLRCFQLINIPNCRT